MKARNDDDRLSVVPIGKRVALRVPAGDFLLEPPEARRMASAIIELADELSGSGGPEFIPPGPEPPHEVVR